MGKLTKRQVEAAEPRDRQYTLWCAELKGFGISINSAGSRTYVVDYRTREGVRRRMALGRHGVVTTDEARKLAIETLAQANRGDDPTEEKRTCRRSLTVADLCDRYLEAAARGLIIGRGGVPKKRSTLAIDRGRIEQHIKPLLGRQLVVDLTRAHASGFLRDVTTGKTARTGNSGNLRGRIRVTGGPGAAGRTSGLLGGILTYVVSESIIDHNPFAGLRRQAGRPRQRRLTPEEYAAIGTELARAVKNPEASWQGIGALWLAALTGCRIGEVVGLAWRNVDLTHGVLVLDDSKTGRSVRPLGRAAAAVLERLPRPTDSTLVFPAPRLREQPYAGIKRFYRGLFARAGLPKVTPHALRHSFASVAAELGFADSTIAACLGHSKRGTTSRYTHILDSVLVAAADKISDEIARHMLQRAQARSKK